MDARLDAKKVIDAIKNSGGVRVWAHPLGGEGEKISTQAEFENKMFPLNIILSDDEKSDWEDNYKKYYRDKKDDELSKQIENEFKELKKIFFEK